MGTFLEGVMRLADRAAVVVPGVVAGVVAGVVDPGPVLLDGDDLVRDFCSWECPWSHCLKDDPSSEVVLAAVAPVLGDDC